MDLESAFGTILKKYRLSNKISQEKLAELSQLDRTFISMLERGKRKATINTLFKLAKGLNVAPSKLIQDLEKYNENN